MKVIKEDGVRLYIDNNKRTPCEWVMHCPVLNGMDVQCNDCPALGISCEMTHEESVAWWEEKEIKK